MYQLRQLQTDQYHEKYNYYLEIMNLNIKKKNIKIIIIKLFLINIEV